MQVSSFWRLLGECPQAASREELKAQSFEGWNPWREPWTRVSAPDIVIANEVRTERLRHLHVYRVDHAGGEKIFAADCVDNIWRFYVPAQEGDAGAVEITTPKYEGLWRESFNEISELPWPQPEYNWPGRETFLYALAAAEIAAERVAYHGYSLCRFCGDTNGNEGLRLAEWEWPAGYRHYIVSHDVRPSAEFADFVLNRKV